MAQSAAGGGVLFNREIDARRAQELADGHPFGAAGDKGALGCHQGDITEEEFLLLDFPGFLDQQLRPDVEGGGVGQVFLPALVLGVVGLAELVVNEAERQPVAGEVPDGGYLLQQLPQAFFLKPAEGVGLDLEQVGYL